MFPISSKKGKQGKKETKKINKKRVRGDNKELNIGKIHPEKGKVS